MPACRGPFTAEIYQEGRGEKEKLYLKIKSFQILQIPKFLTFLCVIPLQASHEPVGYIQGYPFMVYQMLCQSLLRLERHLHLTQTANNLCQEKGLLVVFIIQIYTGRYLLGAYKQNPCVYIDISKCLDINISRLNSPKKLKGFLTKQVNVITCSYQLLVEVIYQYCQYH